MLTARICLDAIETYDETEVRSHFGPIVDGLPAWPFARQNGGDVAHCDFHLFLARYARLPFSLLFRFVGYRFIFILDEQPTRAHTDRVHSPDRATENAPSIVS
eukprot:6208510-Pleurochrysis_carterae.AAC.1